MKKYIYGLMICMHGFFIAKDSFSLLSWNVLSSSGSHIRSFTDPSGRVQFFQPGSYGRHKEEALYVLGKQPANEEFVICLQEVDGYTLKEFKQLFGTKKYIFVGYEPQDDGGGVALFSKGFEVLDSGSMQLPDTAGNKGACVWAALKDRKGYRVLIVNVRIDALVEDYKDGFEQWEMLAKSIRPILETYQCPIVLAGDFNAEYSDVLNYLRNYLSQLLDIRVEMYEHNSITAIDSSDNDLSVDHVLYAGLRLANSIVDTSGLYRLRSALTQKGFAQLPKIKMGGMLLSDHAPIMTTFEFDPKFNLGMLQNQFAGNGGRVAPANNVPAPQRPVVNPMPQMPQGDGKPVLLNGGKPDAKRLQPEPRVEPKKVGDAEKKQVEVNLVKAQRDWLKEQQDLIDAQKQAIKHEITKLEGWRAIGRKTDVKQGYDRLTLIMRQNGWSDDQIQQFIADVQQKLSTRR